MHERSYYLPFSVFQGIGPRKFQLLLKEFGSAKTAWEAGDSSLEKVLGQALTPKFTDFRKNFSIPKYESELKKQKVNYLTLGDNDFPQLLSAIKNPPFVLFSKGEFDFNSSENQRTIAIVGTRKITDYGKQVTQNLTGDLVSSDFVIVSGLALGVDAVAHKTTIENRAKTVAVLGCGVDCCYPRENQAIYNSIILGGGAIVSEYALSVQPSRGSFPSRNRIISGLSQGVLVTEGASDSGALYTAEDAFMNGRPVFAVPGPITSSLSKGPHSLIAKGAKLISNAEEIIQELGFRNHESGNPPTPRLRRAKGDTKEEHKIIELLQNEDMHFDEIVRRTGIDSSKAGSVLSIMEMKGMVRNLDAGFFSLS